MKHVDRCKHLIEIIGGDDLHLRSENLVTSRMIVVPMRVDDVSDRLVGELLDIIDEGPRRRRRGAAIHDQNIRIVDDDNVVAAEPGSGYRRVIDAISDLLKLVRGPLHHGIILRDGLRLCRKTRRRAKPSDRCKNAQPHDNPPSFLVGNMRTDVEHFYQEPLFNARVGTPGNTPWGSW